MAFVDDSETLRSTSRIPWAWIWSIVLTGLFVLLRIKASLWIGRLSAPPTFDDVIYFNDGLARLDILHREGIVGVFRQYVSQPPHSPLWTILAMAGFSTFGIVPWAASAASALPLFILIRIFFGLSGLPLRFSVALIITGLLMPYGNFLVTEFRPDGLMGLLLASGTMVVLLTPWRKERRLQILSAVLFGTALLTKTSFLPLTLCIIFLSVGWAVLPFLSKADRAKSVRAVAVTLGTLCAIMLPYYSIGFRDVFLYISDGVFRFGYVWGPPLPLVERLLYYLVGVGAYFSVGGWMFVSLIIGIFAVFWHAVRADWIWIHRIVGVALTAGLAYFVLTFTNNRSALIGLGFTGFIYIGLLVGVAWLCRLNLLGQRAFAAWAIIFLLFVSTVFSFQLLTPIQTTIKSSELLHLAIGDASARTSEKIDAILAYDQAESTTLNKVLDVLNALPNLRSQRVYMAALASSVNPSTMEFSLRKQGLPHWLWIQDSLSDALDYQTSLLKQARYAVLFTPESEQSFNWLPIGSLRGDILNKALESGFQERARLPDTSGKGEIVILSRSP